MITIVNCCGKRGQNEPRSRILPRELRITGVFSETRSELVAAGLPKVDPIVGFCRLRLPIDGWSNA